MATNYNNTPRAAQSGRTVKINSASQQYSRQAGQRFKSVSEKPKKSGVKMLSIIAMVLGVILLIIAGYLFAKEYIGRQASQKDIAQARSAVAVATPAAPADPQNSSDANAQIPVVDWAKLHKINKDICGWLQIPGTNINYPVVQGATNDDYLKTTISGVSAVEGSIFLDSDSSRNLDDRHSIIYGHNIQNGSMFHTIASYVDKGFFDQHRTIYYITPEKNYVLKAIATYLTDGEDSNVRIFDFSSDAAFTTWLDGRIKKSVVKSNDFDVKDVKHLFEFATCSYSRNDGRTILMAMEDPQANNKSDPNQKPINSSEGQMVKQK